MLLFIYLFTIMTFASAATKTNTRIRRQVLSSASTCDGFKTKQMCDEYITQACNETLSERLKQHDLKLLLSNLTEFIAYKTNIVGGTPSSPKEFPHMALIGVGKYSEVKWICGGSLISENYILSAAHCTTYWRGRPTWIRLGELNSASIDDDATTVDYPIISIIVHPDYRHPYVYNDIALFKFEGLSSFTDYIRPICLNTFYNIPDDQKFTAVGWGSKKFGGRRSDELRSVELDPLNSEKCSSIYTGDKLLSHGFDNKTMLCVGYVPGGKDTCQGDSGGPLQILNDESVCGEVPIYTQIGITSFGVKGCGLANTPAVYTRVSHFIPWIESIVWN